MDLKSRVLRVMMSSAPAATANSTKWLLLPISNLSPHTLKFLNKSRNFLEYALLSAQVQGVEGARFWKNGIEFRATVAGKFTLQ